MPQLRRVEWSTLADDITPDVLDWVLPRKRIATLIVSSSFDAIPRWVAAAQPTSLSTLVLDGRWRVTIARDDAGALSAFGFEVQATVELGDHLARLATVLESLPAGSIRRFTLEERKLLSAPRPIRWTKRARKIVATILARHPGIDHAIAGFEPP